MVISTNPMYLSIIRTPLRSPKQSYKGDSVWAGFGSDSAYKITTKNRQTNSSSHQKPPIQNRLAKSLTNNRHKQMNIKHRPHRITYPNPPYKKTAMQSSHMELLYKTLQKPPYKKAHQIHSPNTAIQNQAVCMRELFRRELRGELRG